MFRTPVEKTKRPVLKTKQTRLDFQTTPFRKLNIDNNTIDHYTNDHITSIPKAELLDFQNIDNALPINTGQASAPNLPTSDTPLFTEKDVNIALGMFNRYNPAVGYDKPHYRKAIKSLLTHFPPESVECMVKDAFASNGQDFAPNITTPVELFNKFKKLEIFLKRKK